MSRKTTTQVVKWLCGCAEENEAAAMGVDQNGKFVGGILGNIVGL